MAFPTGCSTWLARNHVMRVMPKLHPAVRSFSTSSLLHTLDTEDGTLSQRSSTYSTNPLFHVQTFTGIRNMAHGLHLLRTIEATYGPIESYLFPRESGTNEYYPTFFFRFRDPKSLNRLAKPFTRLDVPFSALEEKPNHLIGLEDVGHLISPASDDYFAIQSSEEVVSNATAAVDNVSKVGASESASKPSTRSRYALRIAVSELTEYPQPYYSHKFVLNPRDEDSIQRELAGWRGAAEVFRSITEEPPPQGVVDRTKTLNELLREKFNVPEDTLVLPQKKRAWEPRQVVDNTPQQSGQAPQPPTEYQLFKMHSRRTVRQMRGDPSSDPKSSTETAAEGSPSTDGEVVDSNLVTGSPVDPPQCFGSKRERQLDRMRRAAQARSEAEQKRISEETAKQTETELEAQAPPSKKDTSVWARFLRQ